MAVTAFLYGAVIKNAFDRTQGVDLDTNDVKVMLCTSAYTPNQDTHSDKADVNNEITGTGYTAGGATIANDDITQTNNVVKYDGNDTSWVGATFTANRAAMYDDSGATDADKALIEFILFGEDKSVSSGTFTLQWPAGGIFTVTVSNAAGFP